MITKLANAAQRKSNSEMEDKTWLKSICREIYQKHAPVTSSLTAKIATFWAPPRATASSSQDRCDARPIQLCSDPTFSRDAGRPRSRRVSRAW